MRRSNFLPRIPLFAALHHPLHAQTVETAIIGTVTDSSGAVIPGASITITAVATNIDKNSTTAATGEYSVTYLAPGVYNLAVSAPGFKKSEQKGIVLQINQQARINFSLDTGSAEQTVEVQGTQPLLQSEDSSLGVVVSTKSAENLPLNGRRFDDLAILTPGVTVYNPDNHTSTEDGAAISAYGSQQTWAQVNVDGVTMVNNRHAYVNLYPSVDAIHKFNVLTGNAEADYGGGAGTITNIQIKTGTNSFHGDVFEFLRNTAMDARNFFLVAPAPKRVLKQNQFGATLGGPVIKDRTFFFFSYEGIRSVEQSAGLSNVLTPAEENGDFSALLPSTQLVSPYTGFTYLNKQIPVDPVAQKIAKTYMPQPNTSQNGQNYAYVTRGNLSVNRCNLRLDHKLSDKDQLTFHFLHAYRHSPSADPNPNFTYNGTFPIYNLGLQYVHTFSANLVNEVRLGYDFEHQKLVNTLANTNFTPASIGINGFVQPDGTPWPPPQAGFPILATNDLIGIGENSGIGVDDSRTYKLVDNITWTRGRHALTFGGDIRHVHDDADTSNTPYGVLNFNGSETANNGPNALATESGYDGADFILGVPSSVTTPEGVPLTDARQWRVFAYAQDNWKATSNFTLNLGLRYDLWVPPHDNLNTSATLDWNTPTPTLIPLPTPLWQISHKDFSPRIGFAYSLPQQLVVRGAYGLTFYGGQFDNINILQLNPPKDPSFSLVNGNCGHCSTPNAPTSTFQNPVSPAITPATANVVSIPPDSKRPDLYLQTWNLTVAKQFWSNVIDISYVGVKGTHQDTSLLNFNTGAPQQPGAGVQANRPYPTFGQMRVLDFHGASMYNGLNIHFEHRLTHGLNFTASYSFSNLLDNQGGDTNGVRNETQIPTAKEWANGLTDQRHNLTVAFVWMLPKLAGGNVLARSVVNGWGINAIYQFLAGNPLYVSQATDGENNGNPFQRPDLVAGQSETVANRSIAEWFNTSAFTTAVGHYGSTPRNPAPLVSPSNDPLTLAVNRSFATPFEGQHLDFRVEAFNALNHPLFAAPGST